MSDDPNYRPYFSDVEDTFIRRRGKSLLLSPLDWALIESWKERGVPIHVVLRSIEEVFDNHKSAARRRGINSLRYCEHEVEAQFAEYLESRLGAHEEPAGDGSGSNNDRTRPFSEESVAAHLEKCRRSLIDATVLNSQNRLGLETALTSARASIIEAQATFAGEPNPRILEEALTTIERDLMLAIHHAATPDQVMECREKVETAMADYARSMTEAAYKQTFSTLLDKHLRELFGVPRLSLFHMK